MRRMCVFLTALSLVLSSWPAAAAPPHPKLHKEVKQGLRPEPGYMKRLRETGPPAVRGEKQALQVLRKQGLLPKGGKYEIQQAPGDVTSTTTATASAAPPSLGIQQALVLLVSFSDEPDQTPTAFFDSLVFGGARPSMDHYYREVSDGFFGLTTLDMPSARGWFPLPGTKAGYNAETSLQTMLEDAIAASDPAVDFSVYDNDGDGLVDYLIIVHVGTGGEYTGSDADIWSRTVVLNNEVGTADGVGVDTFMTVPEYWVTPGDMTIGVNVHEFGHLLGLIDLYDTGNDSAGIGAWGLMGYGTWNGPIDRGWSPAYLSAYSRLALGWETPQAPAVNTFAQLLDPVEFGGSVYYLWNDGGSNSEYFLLENRQQISYDEYLPYYGLLVWHIDENMGNNSNQVLGHQDCEWPAHFRVALQQSDGFLDLEKLNDLGDETDPYPGYFEDNTEFALTSTPNSGSYADCRSKVAVSNIQEWGIQIMADILPSAPPAFQAEDYAAFSPLFPGDGVQLTVPITNTGSGATGISAQLVSSNPAMVVTAATSAYPDLIFGETAEGLDPFQVAVASGTPSGSLVDLELHVSADGGYSEVLAFPVVVEPAGVLLVDDDRDSPLDYSSALLGPLGDTGRAAGYWDHLLRGAPPLTFLDRFPSLLWTTGATLTDTLSTEEENLLADYLNGGGGLIFSSQEYYRDKGFAVTSFGRNFLHMDRVFPFKSYNSVSGYPGDVVSDGLGPFPVVLPPGFSTSMNFLLPDVLGSILYTNTPNIGQPGAIRYGGPVFRSSYFAFPLEALSVDGQRENFAHQVPWLQPVGGDSTGNGLADFLVVRPGGAVGSDLLVAESRGYALDAPGDRGDLAGSPDFILRGDLNGDGVDDLATGVAVDPDTVEWSAQLAIFVDTPSGFRTVFDAPFLLAGDAGSAESRFFLGDADGDGLEDLIFTEPNPSRASQADWYVALSDGVSLSQPPALWAASFGKLTQGTLLAGDVNGDGRTDLVWGRSNSAVALSNGSAFVEASGWRDGSGYSRAHFLLGDVNGDGMADIVYSRSGRSGLEWRVSLSTGGAFARARSWSGGFGMSTWKSFCLTDLDGNGTLDLAGRRLEAGDHVFDAAISLGIAFDEGRAMGRFAARPGDRIVP